MTLLHLASSSPRRADLLRALGLRFTAAGVDINESRASLESPQAMVLRLAEEKALAAGISADRVVLGSDTAVVIGDDVLGKPRDSVQAADMLRRLSARTHRVLTGVAVLTPAGVEATLSETKVQFREIGQDEIDAYWQSGEPCDKAGGYAIQGIGGMFVEAIEGSYSGVVGLPVFETVQLLEKAGIHVLKAEQ